MTHPRDPDEVDQTLLPGGAPSVAPPEESARTDYPVNGTHADNTPAGHADATIGPPPPDPEATLDSAAPYPTDASAAESTRPASSFNRPAVTPPSFSGVIEAPFGSGERREAPSRNSRRRPWGIARCWAER